jgi:DnaK suppressor protein
MDKGDLIRYKTLLLANEEELSASNTLAGSTAATSEPPRYPVGMAAIETESAMQVRLKETDGKVLRAIEDALGRIRQGRFGICEGCGHPISKARLEAVPWTRHCKECKERLDSQP